MVKRMKRTVKRQRVFLGMIRFSYRVMKIKNRFGNIFDWWHIVCQGKMTGISKNYYGAVPRI